MAKKVIEHQLKRRESGMPDKWKRNATVNPPLSVPVSSTNTSAKAANKSKKNQQRNPPTALVAGADSNG
jgi:hypothetical protein